MIDIEFLSFLTFNAYSYSLLMQKIVKKLFMYYSNF